MDNANSSSIVELLRVVEQNLSRARPEDHIALVVMLALANNELTMLYEIAHAFAHLDKTTQESAMQAMKNCTAEQHTKMH